MESTYDRPVPPGEVSRMKNYFLNRINSAVRGGTVISWRGDNKDLTSDRKDLIFDYRRNEIIRFTYVDDEPMAVIEGSRGIIKGSGINDSITLLQLVDGVKDLCKKLALDVGWAVTDKRNC